MSTCFDVCYLDKCLTLFIVLSTIYIYEVIQSFFDTQKHCGVLFLKIWKNLI